MALSPLFRDCHIEGPNGLWANYNNGRDYTCSFDGYLMCLTPPHHARLDDMSEREKKNFGLSLLHWRQKARKIPKKGEQHNRALFVKALIPVMS